MRENSTTIMPRGSQFSLLQLNHKLPFGAALSFTITWLKTEDFPSIYFILLMAVSLIFTTSKLQRIFILLFYNEFYTQLLIYLLNNNRYLLCFKNSSNIWGLNREQNRYTFLLSWSLKLSGSAEHLLRTVRVVPCTIPMDDLHVNYNMGRTHWRKARWQP